MSSKELQELTQQSETILKQIRDLKSKERIERDSAEMVAPIAGVYRAFVNEGFTEEQAFDLLKTTIAFGGKK